MNAQADTEVIQQIQLTNLQADPTQPRKYFDKKALQELSNDIASRGIIEPIIYFIDAEGKNTILAGERRFRAANMAELETVPCLLREPGSDIERLLDQVSENFQREGLNPIEMALFFETLIERHEIKPTELPAFLVTYGFKKFDRSYISNIRRLLKLPKWAKTLIQKDQITAAHGKYLLQALPSQPVLKHMQTFLKKPCTTKKLKDEIETAYDDLHIDVCRGKQYFDQEYGFKRYGTTKFDRRKECEKCDTCQILNTEYSTTLYCLNETCYDEKQQAAIVKIEKAEQRRLKTAETKHKNALAKQAEEQGISVEEMEAVEEVMNTSLHDPRANARIERTQKYLDEWLRKQIDTHLLKDLATRYKVILWMAAGAPGDKYHCYTSAAGSVSLDLDDELSEQGIDITLQEKIGTTQLELMTCTAGINSMHRHSLRTLAHFISIKLEDNYIIDRDYLDIKIKSEIIETTPQAVIEAWDEGHWEKLCKKDALTLKDNILFNDFRYGVPADLNAMYNTTEEQ